MMIEGSIVTILLFGWLFLRAARESEERQELRRARRGARRRARARSAPRGRWPPGRGDALRQRILAQAGAEPPAPHGE